MSRARPLVLTWLALLALLALTAASAWVPLGWGNLALNLAVAGAKTILILLVFMRLAHGPAVIRLAAGVMLLWLSILFALSFADYATR